MEMYISMQFSQILIGLALSTEHLVKLAISDENSPIITKHSSGTSLKK